MELINKFIHKQVLFERPQSMKLVNSLLQQIIYSKRLLTDHIELLEQCQVIPIENDESSMKTTILFHFMGALALSSLSLISLKTDIKCLRNLGFGAATTYGLFISAETAVVIRNRLTQHRLIQIISSIEQSDAAIRKNISFFRETKILTASSILDKYNRCANCLKSISEIIRMLYDEVKLLESNKLFEHIECMYEPLEDLSTCIYFQKDIDEFTSDDIKAFYNIFLYFQSQYLTRLGLIIFYAQYNGIKYINTDGIRLYQRLRKHIDKLNIWLDESLRQINAKNKSNVIRFENSNQENVIDSIDLVKIKRSSMDILCRLIAITNQYHNTDQCIQSFGINMGKEEMLNILMEMERFKDSIIACQDDFETLKLIYNKYLVKKFQIHVAPMIDQQIVLPYSSMDDPKSSIKIENIILEDDNNEYFAMRDNKMDVNSNSDDENISSNKVKWSDNLDNIDMKVTRSFFAPVLKQLKTKIDPIKEEMKERELKFLMSKGIEREKIIEFDKNEEISNQILSSNDDTDSDSDSDFQQKPIQRKSQNRYNEMRTFLEQKQQIGFMPLGILPQPSASEDVLE